MRRGFSTSLAKSNGSCSRSSSRRVTTEHRVPAAAARSCASAIARTSSARFSFYRVDESCRRWVLIWEDRRMADSDQHTQVLNESGFPLQIAIEHLVSTTTPGGWRMRYAAHRVRSVLGHFVTTLSQSRLKTATGSQHPHGVQRVEGCKGSKGAKGRILSHEFTHSSFDDPPDTSSRGCASPCRWGKQRCCRVAQMIGTAHRQMRCQWQRRTLGALTFG